MKAGEKLTYGQKHILELIARDKKYDGYAVIGESLYKVVSSDIPAELVIFEKLEFGGRAKLTDEGEAVVKAMKWL